MCGQSHLPLCKPMGCVVLGFSVHWLYASSPLLDLSSWPRDWTYVSCISHIGRQVIYQLCHLGSTLGLWLYLYSFQDPRLYDGKSSISPHRVGMMWDSGAGQESGQTWVWEMRSRLTLLSISCEALCKLTFSDLHALCLKQRQVCPSWALAAWNELCKALHWAQQCDGLTSFFLKIVFKWWCFEKCKISKGVHCDFFILLLSPLLSSVSPLIQESTAKIKINIVSKDGLILPSLEGSTLLPSKVKMLWCDGQGHSFSNLCPSYLTSCFLSLSLSCLFLPLALLYFITQAHGLWAVPRHALYLKTLCLHAWHFLLLERSLNQSLSIGILIYLAAPVLSCGMWDLAPWLGIPDQSFWIESMES